MISQLVIVGLIVVWTIVLLPDVIARISRSRRSDSIRSFNHQLRSLGRSAPVSRGDNVIEFRSRSVATLPAAVDTPSPPDQPASLGAAAPDPTRAPAPNRAPAPTRARRDRRTGPPAPTRSVAATPRAPRPVSPAVRKRRQDVLMVLGAAAALTLLATIAFGGAFLVLHVIADLLLAAYLVLLQRATHPSTGQRRATVTVASPRADLSPPLAALGGPIGRAHPVEPARRIAN